MTGAAVYLYAVVDARTAAPRDVPGIGPPGDVRTVPHRELAAVVSTAPERRLGGRDDLLAHHRVVDAVGAAAEAVLPMRFGAVLPDADAVTSSFLAPQHDRLREMLDQLRGRDQFTLEVSYDRDVVLGEIVRAEPEIARLRDATRGRPEAETHADRVRLGELVVEALERRRAADSERLVAVLAPHTVGVAAGSPGDADTVLRAAFLVDRARRHDFEAAVEGIGRDGGGRLLLRLLGPQPGYDFLVGE